jgi:hypothetical protein
MGEGHLIRKLSTVFPCMGAAKTLEAYELFPVISAVL